MQKINVKQVSLFFNWTAVMKQNVLKSKGEDGCLNNKPRKAERKAILTLLTLFYH